MADTPIDYAALKTDFEKWGRLPPEAHHENTLKSAVETLAGICGTDSLSAEDIAKPSAREAVLITALWLEDSKDFPAKTMDEAILKKVNLLLASADLSNPSKNFPDPEA